MFPAENSTIISVINQHRTFLDDLEIVNNLIPPYFLVRTIFTLTFFQIFAAKQLTEHKRAGQPLHYGKVGDMGEKCDKK